MSDDTETGFYTLKGYDLMEESTISTAMEDYLEMIFRCTETTGYIRVNSLAAKLNVTPPSASKMAAKLKVQGLILFEHYGIITLTEKGREMGEYLLRRHKILHQFFCLLNGSENELRQVERLEHFVSPDTVKNLEALLPQLAMWRGSGSGSQPLL